MKPCHIIILLLLCLITAAFYLSSSSSSSSSASSSSIFLHTGMRSVLKMSLPPHKNRYPKAKVVHDEGLMQQSSGKGSMRLKYSRSNDNNKKDANDDDVDELVIYHIDYHGVATHPTPTPKHP